MCQYIKDNGDQCGMDTEPFCRHHDDTEQAREYEESDEEFEGVQSVTEDADSVPEFGGMDETCEECDASLRRTERLREHPNQSRRVVFEAVVECDCSEHVLGAKSVRQRNLPDGWGV